MAEHLCLKLQELAHEAEVGGDDAPALLDKIKGLLQPHPAALDQVGKADCGRAGDASLTVHQHPPTAILHRICRRQRKANGYLERERALVIYNMVTRHNLSRSLDGMTETGLRKATWQVHGKRNDSNYGFPDL